MLRPPGSSEPTCSKCGAALRTPLERHESLCSDFFCRGPEIIRRNREQEALEKERRAQQARAARAQVREYLGSAWHERVDAAIPLIVPEGRGILAPPPANRVDRLREKLRQSVEGARRLLSEPGSLDGLNRAYTYRDRTVVNSAAAANACTTCGGRCCRQGGDHAFLDAPFLAWRLSQGTVGPAESLIDDYMSRVPERSIEGSCLYHTQTGCALPREIRSSTCNDFLCTGIVDAEDRLRADPSAPTLAISVSSERVERAAWMQRDGSRREFIILDGPER